MLNFARCAPGYRPSSGASAGFAALRLGQQSERPARIGRGEQDEDTSSRARDGTTELLSR
jgi:hypothetical protein